ncbi:hypothetical protein SAMN05880501_106136 [Ureibacillus xyleni]|uniref:Uncharacterized protein n=1 Tax=Ureibacillus xyleni TaxID=614648 RepID=A0A285SSI8_9BACL|nr:hypothetical protein [Ureibacillus xyleni]SOC11360.1 hypothetical protein SAMN05880501_106136 [Ureibacillus xyleni]
MDLEEMILEFKKIRLQKGLHKLLNKVIKIEEITEDYVGFEHGLAQEEIPNYVLGVLADPIMESSVVYKDDNGDYYELCHLYYCGPEPYEIWMKNGDVIKNPINVL